MLRDRLRKLQVANANPANPANVEPQNTPRLATSQISNWWLLHFVDRKPIQLAVWPPCTHAYVMKQYQNAVSAEPISSPADETIDVEVPCA